MWKDQAAPFCFLPSAFVDSPPPRVTGVQGCCPAHPYWWKGLRGPLCSCRGSCLNARPSFFLPTHPPLLGTKSLPQALERPRIPQLMPHNCYQTNTRLTMLQDDWKQTQGGETSPGLVWLAGHMIECSTGFLLTPELSQQACAARRLWHRRGTKDNVATELLKEDGATETSPLLLIKVRHSIPLSQEAI